jgi:hypothetical protein
MADLSDSATAPEIHPDSKTPFADFARQWRISRARRGLEIEEAGEDQDGIDAAVLRHDTFTSEIFKAIEATDDPTDREEAAELVHLALKFIEDWNGCVLDDEHTDPLEMVLGKACRGLSHTLSKAKKRPAKAGYFDGSGFPVACQMG